MDSPREYQSPLKTGLHKGNGHSGLQVGSLPLKMEVDAAAAFVHSRTGESLL